jgi:hypothetical protein
MSNPEKLPDNLKNGLPSYHKGYVPVHRIREAVAKALNITDGVFRSDNPDLVCLTRVWNQNARIWRVLNDYGAARDSKWIDFDTADLMFCLLGLSPNIWWDELGDVYYQVNLDRPSHQQSLKFRDREAA